MKRVILLVIILILSACATPVTYNPSLNIVKGTE